MLLFSLNMTAANDRDDQPDSNDRRNDITENTHGLKADKAKHYSILCDQKA